MASSYVAFKALNLLDDFDYSAYYEAGYYEEIMEEINKLAKSGLNIFDASKENNSKIFNTLNPLFPKEEGKPNPVGLVIMGARKNLKRGDVLYNYLMGDSLLQPLQDFVNETVEFSSDTLVNPILKHLKTPLAIGVGVYIAKSLIINFLLKKKK